MFGFVLYITKDEPRYISISNMSDYDLDEHRSIPCRSSDSAFSYHFQTDSGDLGVNGVGELGGQKNM
jgi:hypothetical protein